ncbi:hypothetical protein GQ54DRAFT_115683 [Martensiomyces pterosporus]|nr:hypothetical protein GQ54DRAFT_115683 [Martensiomyces pterosporus]
MRAFLGANNTSHTFSAPLHPQSELAETAVKRAKSRLRCVMADTGVRSGGDWVEHVSRAVAADVLTLSPSLGTTPYHLFFGERPGEAEKLQQFGHPEDARIANDEMAAVQQQIAHELREHKRRRALAYHNKNVVPRWFEPGSWVSRKLVPKPTAVSKHWLRRTGPFRVVERKGTLYALMTEEGNLLPRLVPGDELQPYNRSERPVEERTKIWDDSLATVPFPPALVQEQRRSDAVGQPEPSDPEGTPSGEVDGGTLEEQERATGEENSDVDAHSDRETFFACEEDADDHAAEAVVEAVPTQVELPLQGHPPASPARESGGTTPADTRDVYVPPWEQEMPTVEEPGDAPVDPVQARWIRPLGQRRPQWPGRPYARVSRALAGTQQEETEWDVGTKET